MNNRLFIIGNGFDLAHGLPTKYWNYHEYLMTTEEKWMANMLEFYFGNEPKAKENLLWSDLERALGIYSVKDIYSFLREGHDLDLDHLTRSIGEVDAEVEYHFVNICKSFQETFTSWCRSIDLSETRPKSCFSFGSGDFFLSFNYSDTLEEVYGVDKDQVLHIHGRASTGDDLIIGHNKPAIMPNDIQEDFYDHEANYKAIVETINKLEKKTKKIIGENQAFFGGIGAVKEIIVIGHSMAEVDMDYFKEVNMRVANRAKWKFSFYDEDEIDNINQVATILGIIAGQYSTFQL